MGYGRPLDLSGIPWANGSTNSTGTMMAGGNVTLTFAAPSLPIIAAPGPLECSTSTELVLDPVVINDGNHYYKALGFSWPYRGISKLDLRKAYQRLDGQNSRWKTYAFKQLLDKKLRRIYDRLPLGQQIVDVYVFEMRYREAARQAARANVGGATGLSANDLMRSWGIPVVDPDEESTESNEPVGAQDTPSDDRDQSGEEPSPGDEKIPESWLWGYVAWRSSCRDAPRLAVWQQMLIQAAREQERRLRFAVGFLGQAPHRCLTAVLPNGTIVIYLHEDVEPTEELAAHAIASTNSR